METSNYIIAGNVKNVTRQQNLKVLLWLVEVFGLWLGLSVELCSEHSHTPGQNSIQIVDFFECKEGVYNGQVHTKVTNHNFMSCMEKIINFLRYCLIFN